MTKPFNHIGVFGSGTMGAGIAQICALSGYATTLYDLNPEILAKAMTRIHEAVQKAVEKQKAPPDAMERLAQNLKTTHQLTVFEQPVDLIIEAVPEDMKLKRQLFNQLDAMCPPQTCLVSNTSSLSVTAMAAATKRPQQVAGMHFFNPVAQMKLVEVITGKQTAPALADALCELAVSLGKTPVKAKDTPGFIVNRVARSFYGEAFRLLEEGVADVATLDAIVKGEGGFPMGPFELMDLIGIDVNYAVTQSVYNAYFQESRFKPHPIQRQMVEAGHLGRKTKQGFYRYDER